MIAVNIASPLLTIPRTKITAKKDFTEKDKRVEFKMDVAGPVPKSVSLYILS